MTTSANAPSRAEAVVAAATGSVTLTYDEAIAEIALANGPMNLVTRPMLRQLNKAIADIAVRSDIRALIVHGGEARAFCAGSDIKEFDGLREDASEYKILFEDLVLRNLAELHIPTIAALNGHALGGGFEIALCCDLRVLERGAKIGLPENKHVHYRLMYDLLALASFCDRVAILHQGEIVETAEPEAIFADPQHPYTQQLVDALPRRMPARRSRNFLSAVPSAVPLPWKSSSPKSRTRRRSRSKT